MKHNKKKETNDCYRNKNHFCQSHIPRTIAASYLIGSGVVSCDNKIISLGTIPCEITNVFCLSLPMTTFFKQINDS